MTVDAAYISNISGYAQGADFTPSQLTQFLGVASDRLNREDPGLGGYEHDQALALLVCHQIYMAGGAGQDDGVSIRTGDESKTRMMDKDGLPTSPWLQLYKDLIKGRVSLPSAGVQRSDVMTSTAFRMSNQKLPMPVFNDGGLGQPKSNTLNQ